MSEVPYLYSTKGLLLMLIFQQNYDFSTVPQHPRRYTHKTSGCKMSGFKTSGFKTSGFKTPGLQNVRFQNVWFQNVQFLNLIYLLYKSIGIAKLAFLFKVKSVSILLITSDYGDIWQKNPLK